MTKKSKIILAAVAGVALVAGLIWYFFFKTEPIEYRYADAKKGEITIKILTTGTVLPDNRLQIKSPIAGRVEKILVAEGDKIAKGQILAWVSSTERAVMLDSARTQGEAEVKKWEEIYKPTPIIAPLPGTIILRNAEPGQTFTTSDAIFVMSDRLTIQAQVDETDLAQMHVGQAVQFTLDAYLDKKIEAKVSQIAYEAKTVNNVTTYTVKILPNEEIPYLRSGMTANVTFFGEIKKDILVVPNEYIKYVDGQPQVQLDKDKKPMNQNIKAGITDGKNTEVLEGLAEGDKLVLTIKKDTKAKNSMFSPSGSGGRR